MRRRGFISVLGCAAAAGLTRGARAQSSNMPLVGFLNSASAAIIKPIKKKFIQNPLIIHFTCPTYCVQQWK